MRILFATDAKDEISTQLNTPNFARLKDFEGVHIDFYNHNYADYDVVLFMGYDARVAEARAAKPDLKIGVIDLRPSSIERSLGADFVIANGMDMQDWLSDYFEHIFVYPIYPVVNAPQKVHSQREPIIIGYHGNKVHLSTLAHGIGQAMELLSDRYKLELWAAYDIDSLGAMPFDLCDPRKVQVRYFQWTHDVYEKVMSQVDIGIVPTSIPIQEETAAKEKIISHSALFNPHPSDILLRYKCTSNAGRIFVFSQLGIPVVTGMSPSSAQTIRHGENGFLANSIGGWYNALKKLAESVALRKQMGQSLYDDFVYKYSPEVLNQRLIDFIANLPARSNYPVDSFVYNEKKISIGSRPASTGSNIFQRLKRLISRLF